MLSKLFLKVSDFSMKVAKLIRCPNLGTVEQFSVKVDRDMMSTPSCLLILSAISVSSADFSAVKS